MAPERLLLTVVLALCTSACTHMIAFDDSDTSWHYSTGAARLENGAVVAVIDPLTLEKTFDFRAWSTGIAHKWIAQTGVMLAQVSDVEFPQLFESYQRSTSYAEPPEGDPRVTVVLTVPEYAFEGYRATVRVHAEVFGPNKLPLFAKDYTGSGGSGAGKMIGLGAFGQKSAVRQSSLDAFRSAFDQLRPDLLAALSQLGNPSAPQP